MSSRRAMIAISAAPEVLAEENVREQEVRDKDQDDRDNDGPGRGLTDAGCAAARLESLIRADQNDDPGEDNALEQTAQDVADIYGRPRRLNERVVADVCYLMGQPHPD